MGGKYKNKTSLSGYRDVKIRVTTLLRRFLTKSALLTSQLPGKPQSLKSLSDVTVAPVVPTGGFNTLLTEWTSSDSRLLPCTTRQLSAAFVPTTLSAQTHLACKIVEVIIALACLPVKHFCSLCEDERRFQGERSLQNVCCTTTANREIPEICS